MAELIYSAICSLDGFVEDADGGFAWAQPDEEVHRFVNDLERGIGTYLYGRGMYETMAAWESDPALTEAAEFTADFARIWQAAEKIVFSRTLESVTTARTRLEREFDPGAVRALKESADRDLSVGGAGLAAEAFAAGLVDECHLILVPYVAGGGKPALPRGQTFPLELVAERRFGNGTVHLHHRVGRSDAPTAA